jgi:hypothetical protein
MSQRVRTVQREWNPYQVLEERAKDTPDWDELKASTQDEFPVFVVGQMRRFHKANNFMEGCNYYGFGLTWDNNFIMKSGGNDLSEPHLFQFDDKVTNWTPLAGYFSRDQQQHVEGDIYGVPLNKLAMLDQREGNTNGVTRVKRHITMMAPIQGQQVIRAFMYTVDIDFFLDCFGSTGDMKLCPTVVYKHGHDRERSLEAYRV